MITENGFTIFRHPSKKDGPPTPEEILWLYFFLTFPFFVSHSLSLKHTLKRCFSSSLSTHVSHIHRPEETLQCSLVVALLHSQKPIWSSWHPACHGSQGLNVKMNAQRFLFEKKTCSGDVTCDLSYRGHCGPWDRVSVCNYIDRISSGVFRSH